MPKRIHHRRRAVLGLIAAAVLVAGGTAAARAMTGGDGNRYRTATAGMGSVEQLLTGVGTVSAVNQVSVSFPVAGTVATVPVSVGSRVSAGQTLATLSTTALNQSVDSANSTLATAQQTLATDQASQTDSTATESSVQLGDGESTDGNGAIVLTAAVSRTPPGSGGQPTGGTSVSQLIAQITAAQKAVIGAQQKLDQDLSDAESSLQTCQNALSAGSTPPSSTPPSSTPPSSTPPSSTPPSSTPTPAADNGDATCLAAIAAAPTKADAAKDQQARDAAEQTLDTAIQKLEKLASSSGNSTGSGNTGGTGTGGTGTGGTGTGKSSGGSSGKGAGGSGTGSKTGVGSTGSKSGNGFTGGSSTGGSSSSSRSSSGNSSGSGQSGGSRTSSGPASAAQLAADQAQIDAASAELVVAQQNLKAATLTSPLAGTVAEVSITAGKNAGSNTITVIGAGQSQVTTTVALADIDKVKVGDPATVKVDGINTDLAGTVSLIGIVNTTSGSSTAYPVTILLDATSQKLYDGSGATTSIRVAQVSNVLTVPSSAVRTLGQFESVTVLTNGKPVITRVTVGAVGTDRTQIRSGLKAGQPVVLADLSTKLPTSSS